MSLSRLKCHTLNGELKKVFSYATFSEDSHPKLRRVDWDDDRDILSLSFLVSPRISCHGLVLGSFLRNTGLPVPPVRSLREGRLSYVQGLSSVPERVNVLDGTCEWRVQSRSVRRRFVEFLQTKIKR